jgi:hypothetical protein
VDRADFAELLEQVRHRPRMWLADERFTTLVAFVDGVDEGNGRALLAGFNEWLAHQYLGHESSVAWWGLVGRAVRPGHIESRTYYGDLDENASEPFNAELFDRLLDYLNDSN